MFRVLVMGILFVLSELARRSGVPGKVPAAGGRLTGQFVVLVLRAAGSTVPVSLTSYAVVGAAAYMGGATRMTLTTTVMVMETTGSLQLIVPIMITVFVAKVTTQRNRV